MKKKYDFSGIFTVLSITFFTITFIVFEYKVLAFFLGSTFWATLVMIIEVIWVMIFIVVTA